MESCTGALFIRRDAPQCTANVMLVSVEISFFVSVEFYTAFFFPVLFFSYFKLNESLLKTKAKQSSFCQAGLTSIVK